MENSEQIKLVNQGYMWGFATPQEFQQALTNKLNELKANSQDKERWSVIAKGYELALTERQKEREQQLKQLKSRGRRNSKGRTR